VKAITRVHVIRGLILLTLSGCAIEDGSPPARSSYSVGNYVVQERDPGRAAYGAVDQMLDAAPGRLNPNGTIIVGTIADIRDVERSSAFGNLISDYVRTRLVQRGEHVSQLSLRSSVKMSRYQGEMVISRNAKSVLRPAAASEIVTGTYAVGLTQVHVSLKIVSASTGLIIAAADFDLPRYLDANALLGFE
jgi:TolB-like protein